MKRSMSLSCGVLLALAGAVKAQTPGTCSNATLSGAYGVTISGTRPAPSILSTVIGALPGYLEQVIGVVIQTFDGKGNYTQVDNTKGTLSGYAPDRPGSGTYTVNPDCTGGYTLSIPAANVNLVVRMVVVNGGKEFQAVVVSPQAVMVSAHGQKMN